MSSDKSNEDLIAYLDGELPDESASAVEKSLVEDASVRRDVEQLTRTFDLLDLLPTSKASDGFADKTLTAIRTQTQVPGSETAEEDVLVGKRLDLPRTSIQWGLRATAFLGLMFVATVGFNSAFRQGSEPIDELLSELPLIQRLDEYEEIGDVKFLNQLSESGLFDERDEPPQD
jgi:anti-sigma factor RsiW